jgi:hypothetical protein
LAIEIDSPRTVCSIAIIELDGFLEDVGVLVFDIAGDVWVLNANELAKLLKERLRVG